MNIQYIWYWGFCLKNTLSRAVIWPWSYKNHLWQRLCLESEPGGCFTKVSRALQNNLAKIHNARNHISDDNFKLKLCTCAQSYALGSRTKFQLEILIKSTISVIREFRENILESWRNLSETTPRSPVWQVLLQYAQIASSNYSAVPL